MKIMVVGGGGREHALVHALKKSPRVETIYALPGNGGIAQEAICVDVAATDIQGVIDFAKKEQIDFAVIGPDDPLVMGIVDALAAEGIRCFGPDQKAAEIEGSKAFAKNLMHKYDIPTAAYDVYDDMEEALASLVGRSYPLVVKADGLALGKGVFIVEDETAARQAIWSIMSERVFGNSGSRIVLEEYLQGPEATVLAFTDGKTLVPMVSSMDHKRALDGDKGPNTGGMGVVAPNPFYTPEIAKQCMEEIFLPTIRAMEAEGRPFKGCLYFGLMLTSKGPKVIEYNCRFGDPEAQAVLALLETDLLTVMEAVQAGTLDQVEVKFSNSYACCLMAVSGGYPGEYQTGKEITLGTLQNGVELFHSGTGLEDGKLVTTGGRVLGITAVAYSLWMAVDMAYAAAKHIRFDGMYYRSDIGAKALEG